ncbi:MAG: twin-arginine translocation protein TatA/E family subunit [Solirubrobacterales bacterium]|jgi:sec-independent protein translocase protein TatA|nr:twin-arginine translocation protein TatA/E family subunit [Solirubrobacterales bacterium]
MPNIGPMELIVVLAIALMVLGPKKLPEVGRSVGKGLREFKDSVSGNRDDDERESLTAAVPAPVAAPAREVHTPS